MVPIWTVGAVVVVAAGVLRNEGMKGRREGKEGREEAKNEPCCYINCLAV
jgi:hypothetical protein